MNERPEARRVRAKGWGGNITIAVLVIGILAALLVWVLGGRKSPAEEVYVAPGKFDRFYAFLSGGHAGQVLVYGIPSGRLLNIIPVFSPYARTGWGFDEHSKRLMGDYTWGDLHHTSLSQTDGKYDGRWLFVNDNANARVARVNLSTFRPEEIVSIPNVAGNHASPWVTPGTEYVFAASRFSIPIPSGTFAPPAEYAKEYDGVIAGIKVAPSGKMRVAWEVRMPPIDFDLASSGKGPSFGYAFFSSYNTEEAYKRLEIEASQHERDFITVLDWKLAERAASEGKGQLLGGVPVLDPEKVPGLVTFVPCPKSPHGVDVSPDGRYIVGSGKLAPVVSIFDIERIKEAAGRKDYEGRFRGIPVLRYPAVSVAEVPVGLGPLHTQFDDKGFAYTSLFVDSKIARWKLGTWEVVERVPVTYNIGHLAVAGGDSSEPYGQYMLALNKMTKDRFLGVGPDYPTNAQLFDIRGGKMRLLLDFPTLGEPHYGVMIPASLIKPVRTFSLAENVDPFATKTESAARVERKGNRVDVYMTAIRSHFTPDNVEVRQGDDVFIHVTNLEQEPNIAHGLAVTFSNIDIEIAPGETKSIHYRADRPGVYPFYCSNFCSALHQEMQGYLTVRPRD